MDSASQVVDKGAALKAKSRQAILNAASDLMQQRRSAEFSVDDLAAAAGVSRRMVFNHFTSLEDVVTEVAAQILGEVVDRMEERASRESGEARTVLEDLAATASSVHLVPTVAFLVEIFDGADVRESTRAAVLMHTAMRLFTRRMSAVMGSRHPDVAAAEMELLVAAFSGGMIELVDRWVAETAAVDTAESRKAWDGLISTPATVLRDPFT